MGVSAEGEQPTTACTKEAHLDCGIYCGSGKVKLLCEVKSCSLAEWLKAGAVSLIRCHRDGGEKDC